MVPRWAARPRVTTSGGVATFGNLTLDRLGSDYTLVADASGLPSTTSNAFQVTAGPAVRIAFAVQPTNIDEGQPFNPEVVVEVQDAFGNRVTTAGGTVTVTLRQRLGRRPAERNVPERRRAAATGQRGCDLLGDDGERAVYENAHAARFVLGLFERAEPAVRSVRMPF